MSSTGPQKIVSLLPSATEIVCALGIEDRLVGITHECDYPAHIAHLPAMTASRISHETMTSSEIDHAVRSQLDGHGSIYDLDTDLLNDLDPALIITQELCDVCAVNYKQVTAAAKISAAGAQVVSLEPNTIDDIFENILTVGELAGVTPRAGEVVQDFRDRLAKIGQQTADLTRRPRVFVLEWLDPAFAPGHWVPEQVEIAGGEALLGKPGERSVTTTYDAILESNPEVIVLAPCGYYKEDTLRQLKNTKFPAAWRSIEAVKTRNIWAVDATSYFSRPGPRVVDGAEILARIINPRIFEAPSPDDAVRVELEFE